VAAEKGNAWAQFELGNCYIRGAGVEKSVKEALKWWVIATEKGYFADKWRLNRIDRSRMIELMSEEEDVLQESLEDLRKLKEPELSKRTLYY
jgi:TPR repeat protein